jgi:hypothetical protein
MVNEISTSCAYKGQRRISEKPYVSAQGESDFSIASQLRGLFGEVRSLVTAQGHPTSSVYFI